MAPATPAPAAVLASANGVAAPAIAAGTLRWVDTTAAPSVSDGPRVVPRARSAPTQALLETFRN